MKAPHFKAAQSRLEKVFNVHAMFTGIMMFNINDKDVANLSHGTI